MRLVFPFEWHQTELFGIIKRPVADVLFWSEALVSWIPVKMVVDTGADYTLLPLWLSEKIGINLKKDCTKFLTRGVGGTQKVFLIKDGWKVKLGDWEKKVVLGFLADNDVPPLLGRLHFLENLKVTFENYKTIFEI